MVSHRLWVWEKYDAYPRAARLYAVRTADGPSQRDWCALRAQYSSERLTTSRWVLPLQVQEPIVRESALFLFVKDPIQDLSR
jgi:hypothetical protein